MSPPAATFGTGVPVEIGKIERELKKLWEQGGELMTRASLINLAVYSEAPDSLSLNTQIVAQITEDHACRAIVIAVDPAKKQDHVDAWIAAHCHVSRAGTKQVCSEQISFAVSGSLTNLLPNIVFSHLDSDLPFYLWWQGELHDAVNPQFWNWVDRVIYDSGQWRDFSAQLQLLEAAHQESNERLVLCDLNWMRLVQMRLAIAQFFDAPAAREQLGNIERVEIAHAARNRSTAMLLAGWLAAQLGWIAIEAADENTVGFSDCAGETIRVVFSETAGEAISRCSLLCGPAEFRVSHRAAADLLDVTTHQDGGERMRQLMPAGRDDPAALVSEELMRGGPHRVYLHALEVVRELL